VRIPSTLEIALNNLQGNARARGRRLDREATCFHVYILLNLYYIREQAMNAKLTLRLDKEVIEQAKVFSQKHHKSLSKLVENYLRQITRSAPEKEWITPLVAELSGLIKPERAKSCKD
jgi:dsDNA-specific endonuclease/ATPase MutS2